MKRLIAVLLILTLGTGVFCSCKKDQDTGEDTEVISSDVVIDEDTPELTPEMLESMQPQEVQIRNICQLATLEVYFHNVAKAVKPAGTGILDFTQADRRFWVEYSGTATVGIDMSRVSMIIDEDNITVRIPHARLIGDINVDSSSYDVDSIYTESQDWWRVKNEISAADVTNAIREANVYTQLSVINNRSIMMRAEDRATKLIRNYIEQLSKYSDKNYTINFEYIDAEVQ